MQHPPFGAARESPPNQGIEPGIEHHDSDREPTGVPHHEHHVLDRLHALAVTIEGVVEHVVEHEKSAEVIELNARFDAWDRALDHYLEDRRTRKPA